MIKVSKTKGSKKVTPPQKKIELEGISVKDLKFIDETGDITQQVLDALPEGTETLSFKITVDLQDVGSEEQ